MNVSFRQFPWILAMLAGCGAQPPAAPYAPAPPSSIAVASPEAVGREVADDPEVAALVARYRGTLGERLSETVATASAEITPSGEPSNALGVLVADEMLAHLAATPGLSVDCFVTNDGGLRAPLYPGPVQLKHVFEVMPFDNELVVLEIDGAGLQRIADAIAKKNGEPVAGLRMLIDPAVPVATEVTVGGRPLEPTRTYHVGTTDYLAESGWLSDLAKGHPLAHTGILMRDAIIARFRLRGPAGAPLAPAVDDRIRLVPKEQKP
jgi:2',3'-cyclic-nucleotide 2'-phosphodiesterase (5'-nucleotidase family)